MGFDFPLHIRYLDFKILKHMGLHLNHISKASCAVTVLVIMVLETN